MSLGQQEQYDEEDGDYLEERYDENDQEYEEDDMEGQYEDEENKIDYEDESQKYEDEESEDQKTEQRQWAWAQPLIEGVSPNPRGGHTATLSGAAIIIFGGHYYAGKEKGYEYLNGTKILDVNENKWKTPKISGTPPAPRYNHTAILAGNRIIIFGGKGKKGQVFRDLHALDPLTLTWYQGPEGSGSPTARFSHTANVIGGSKMLIFGGWNGKSFFNDLYILDLEVMAWSQPTCTGPAPSPRMGHCAIQIGTNLLIQGGFYFNEEKYKQGGLNQGTMLKNCYLNDLRILDTETFVWSRLRVSGTPPNPRYGHTASISGPDIVFFGGWTYESGKRIDNSVSGNTEYFTILNTNTMSWDLAEYKGKAPPCRYGHTVTSIGPHLLIFGGWEHTRSTNEVVVLRDLNLTNDPNKLDK